MVLRVDTKQLEASILFLSNKPQKVVCSGNFRSWSTQHYKHTEPQLTRVVTFKGLAWLSVSLAELGPADVTYWRPNQQVITLKAFSRFQFQSFPVSKVHFCSSLLESAHSPRIRGYELIRSLEYDEDSAVFSLVPEPKTVRMEFLWRGGRR